MTSDISGRARVPNGRPVETRLALVGLLVFLALYGYRVMTWELGFRDDGWVTGDWLINYSQGFIRRGLIGALADAFRALGGGSPVTFVLITKALLYLVSCASIFVLAWRRTIGFIELALLISPWALMFDLNSPGGAGRKELVLLAAFTVYCVLADRSADRGSYLEARWVQPFLVVVFPLLTLAHEGLFFFLQFFLCHAWLSRPNSSTLRRAFFAAYGIAACLFIASALFRGTSAQAAALCSSLTDKGLSATLCVGSIEYLDGHGALGTFGFRIHKGYFQTFVPLAALTFLTLAFYGRQVLDRRRHGRVLVACVAAVLATAPLYVAGGDWGRWIHTSAMLVFLTLFTHRRAPSRLDALPPVALVGLLLILPVYTCLWRMPHWIGPRGGVRMVAHGFANWTDALFGPLI